MWHKPCRTFHPWCPCIKTRCLCGKSCHVFSSFCYLTRFSGVTFVGVRVRIHSPECSFISSSLWVWKQLSYALLLRVRWLDLHRALSPREHQPKNYTEIGCRPLSNCKAISTLCRSVYVTLHPWRSQHGRCWCPGAHSTVGQLQQPWWRRQVLAY